MLLSKSITEYRQKEHIVDAFTTSQACSPNSNQLIDKLPFYPYTTSKTPN